MTEGETNLGELFAALAKAQGAMAAAAKDRSVGYAIKQQDGSYKEGANVKYSYATLAEVWEACRKPLSENGLAVVQQVTQAIGNSITINSILGHASGQSINSLLTMPVAGGTAQAVGSAITYARRYSLMALVGIVADEDDDGQEASGKGDKKTEQRQAARPAPVTTTSAPTLMMPTQQAPVQALSPMGAARPPKPVAAPAQPAPSAAPHAAHWIDDPKTRNYFWAKSHELGFTPAQTHALLGVTSVKLYPGTMEQAIDQLLGASDMPADPAPFTDDDPQEA